MRIGKLGWFTIAVSALYLINGGDPFRWIGLLVVGAAIGVLLGLASKMIRWGNERR